MPFDFQFSWDAENFQFMIALEFHSKAIEITLREKERSKTIEGFEARKTDFVGFRLDPTEKVLICSI